MSRSFGALCLFAAACSTPTSQPAQPAPLAAATMAPPNAYTLEVESEILGAPFVYNGRQVALTITGAPPNSRAFFGFTSTPAAAGVCPPTLNGLCLDIG